MVDHQSPQDARLMRSQSDTPWIRRLARRGLIGLAVVLTAYTVIAQLLAIVPVSWTMPLLQWSPLQAFVILIGALRDILGIWNIAIGAAALAIFIWVDMPRRRRAWTGISLSALGSLAAVATTVMLLVAVAPTGVGLLPIGNPFLSHATTPTKTVDFGEAGGVKIQGDLYTPDGTSPKAGWPVVVSIHGGGFSTGTRGPNLYTQYLPKHGYAVLDVDYRVATPTFQAWDTQVGDIGCALGWLGRAGATHGLDVERIATYGESSGGNLAINSAYMANNQTLTSTCDPEAVIPEVNAVISAYPAVNLTGLSDTSAIARTVQDTYVGGTPAEYPERYKYVNSASHVSEASPPTFVYTGNRDHLVLPSTIPPFIETLAQRGVVHKYVTYPGMEHGVASSMGSNYATAASLKAALTWLEKYDR